MKNSHTLTCLPMKFTLPILNQLQIDIEITDNPYHLQLDQLFYMAARMNKKRSFLFVSRILGKHLPINPKIGLLTGQLLANRYMEMVNGVVTGRKDDLLSAFMYDPEKYNDHPFIDEHVQPVIIGFAETATALGHAFYHSFQKADFFHTTREELRGMDPVITFEEEHSHATSHRCYVDESILNNDRDIILVDDEMTTGKTNINIIRSIHMRFPRKSYTVVSILDWRSKENHQQFQALEKELGITIHSVSLLKGRIQLSGAPMIENCADDVEEIESSSTTISTIFLNEIFPELLSTIDASSITLGGMVRHVPYLKETGRFGLDSSMTRETNRILQKIADYLVKETEDDRILCLGTGEFMYIPMKIASYMGEGVQYHSTTRSPIYVANHEKYGAKYGLAFPNPEDWEIDQFVYNIPQNEYNQLFVFFERAISKERLQPMLNELKKTKIPNIKIVFLNGRCSDE
ncbi:hypothetical protein J2Z40_001824 [Cytobacillus eiseniae]|uniref:Adenine/guanine phosphoribosyltransferase n=1 Tax=Cytobacillus eiseniae TaxID=762947 RepID=A0ABS4RHF1_9BACI|nr:phosphoribosyltransferase family protein [Cytobacillus eiseniae]MBP2241262.1 hypothetical protein [Cytobacillus eiseniae]